MSLASDVTQTDIATILIPTVIAFLVGALMTPAILKALYKYKMWRRQELVQSVDGRPAPITKKLNNDAQRQVPRMGGLAIVVAVLATTLICALISRLGDGELITGINLVSRTETWLPLFALAGGFVIGFLDDLIVAKDCLSGRLKRYIGGGLPLGWRILVVAAIGVCCGWWFFVKLGVTSVEVPFWQEVEIGWLIIPFIVIVAVATYSGGIIDGVDGLSGGVFATIFSTYASIAFLQGNLDLATFCLVIVGGILAFLWFNVPPASFYMSETGTMALTLTLSIIAFVTDTALLLPIIGLPLLWTSLSVILQVLSKKYRGKKLFLVSPYHNHLRAKGWQGPQVTMRYWIVSQVCGISGLAVFLLGYV